MDQNESVELRKRKFIETQSKIPKMVPRVSMAEPFVDKKTGDDRLDAMQLKIEFNANKNNIEPSDNENENLTTDETRLLSSSDSESEGKVRFTVHPEPHVEEDESAWVIFLQVLFPFLVAGLGMVGAGLVLDIVQHWRVFTQVPEIFILVPALLGLKGNLEMTLASRLSTLANLGRMDSAEEQFSVISSNLALIQCQAAVVAFLASLFAILLAWVPKGNLDVHHAVLLCSSSLTTASLASLALGIVMVIVVILSRKYKVNPDNVATPIAASLGDLITLAVLSVFGTLFLDAKTHTPWLNWVVASGFMLGIPLWAWLASKNHSTFAVLKHGWSPVIFAMLISSAGGFILKFAVQSFRGIAVFQPVINGVGGNLVAVQASRISTGLHMRATLGTLPQDNPKCPTPKAAFFGSSVNARAARVLLIMVVPGHLIFMYMIHFLQAGHTSITLRFAAMYLLAAVIQVIILLYVCMWMVDRMWASAIDPDNSAIPYLTALGDLLGTALLAVAFKLLYLMGDRDADIGE